MDKETLWKVWQAHLSGGVLEETIRAIAENKPLPRSDSQIHLIGRNGVITVNSYPDVASAKATAKKNRETIYKAAQEYHEKQTPKPKSNWPIMLGSATVGGVLGWILKGYDK